MFRRALVATNANFRGADLSIEPENITGHREREKERDQYLFITIFINELLNSHDEATCQTKQAIDHNVS